MKSTQRISLFSVFAAGVKADIISLDKTIIETQVTPLDAVNPPYEPSYIGCFPDNGNRDVREKYKTIKSKKECVEFCGNAGYPFAAIQFAFECRCGKAYGKYGFVRDEQCNMKCKDGDEGCGSEWMNSIYSTGRTFRFDKLFREDIVRRSIDILGGRLESEGTVLHSWFTNDTPAQKFRFVGLGNGRVRIVPEGNLASCVTSIKKEGLEDNDIVMHQCGTIGLQEWLISEAGEGTVFIIEASLKQAIDLEAGNILRGANLFMRPHVQVDNERWIIVSIPDSY